MRRGQQAQFQHHAVVQFRTARIQGHGRVGVVGLHAEKVHSNAAGTHHVPVAPKGIRDAIDLETEVRAALGIVNADVLARVFRGTGTLDADIAVTKHEVVLLAERGPEIDVGDEVGLLVVRLVHLVKTAGANDTHHALTLGAQLVDINVAAASQDVVLLVQAHHVVAAVGVHHAVVQELVVTQGTVVDTDVLQLHVGGRAVNGDARRVVLAEIVAVVVDVSAGTVAVHVKFHQTAVATPADDEGDFQPLLGGELRADLDFTARILAVLVRIMQDRAGLDARLLARDAKAFTVIHTADHFSLAVRHPRYTELHLDGRTGGTGIILEKVVADNGLRAPGQFKALTRPAVRTPVEALEGGLHAVILPVGRITLTVTASGGAQLHLETVGCLADIDAAIGHVDVESVGGSPDLQLHLLAAFFSEAVPVGLGRTGDAHPLEERVVPVNVHTRRGGTRVIGGKFELAVLVPPHLDDRGKVVGTSEDAAVPVGDHQTHVGGAAAALQDIDINALAFERQAVTGIHLGNHLDGMTPHRQGGHGEGETAVRGTATGHSMGILLLAVNVQRHHFRSRTTHGVGDVHGLLRAIATGTQPGGDIVAAGKGQGHAPHAHIGLSLLRLPGHWVGGLGYHIDIARAGKEVFRKIERVRALAHVLGSLRIGGGGTTLHLDGNFRFLTGTLALLVTAAVLVVIGIGKPYSVTLFDGGLVHVRAQNDFRGAALPTATATAGGDVETGHLDTAFVLQAHVDGGLVITQFGGTVEDGTGFHLAQFRRHGAVLDRVRAFGVQALVHLHLLDGQAHVALRVRDLLLTVHRQALHRAGTAEVLPACGLFPCRQACTYKLFRLPSALRGLVGDATALVPVFHVYGGDGRLQGIVTVLQGNLLRHVVRVAAAPRTAGNVGGGDCLPVTAQDGQFHRVVLLVRDGCHATHQAAVHGCGGILRLLGGGGGRTGSGIGGFSGPVCGTGGVRRGLGRIGGAGRGIIGLRGGSVSHRRRVLRGFPEQRHRRKHDLLAAHRRKALDIVQRGDLGQFIDTLALRLDGVQDVLLQFVLFRFCQCHNLFLLNFFIDVQLFVKAINDAGKAEILRDTTDNIHFALTVFFFALAFVDTERQGVCLDTTDTAVNQVGELFTHVAGFLFLPADAGVLAEMLEI